jgi:ribonuclease inhibitor
MTLTDANNPLNRDGGRADLVEVDLSAAMSSRQIHELLYEALNFPGFYGHNWNAFWDAITGLVPMPRRLVLRGWGDLESRLPEDAKLLRGCLYEMAAKYPEDAADVTFA